MGQHTAIGALRGLWRVLIQSVNGGNGNLSQTCKRPSIDEALQRVKSQQSDAEILQLVEDLKGQHKVRWKDSMKRVLRCQD